MVYIIQNTTVVRGRAAGEEIKIKVQGKETKEGDLGKGRELNYQRSKMSYNSIFWVINSAFQ